MMTSVQSSPFAAGEARVRFLGLRLTPATAVELSEIISTLPDRPTLVLNHNLHSVYMCEKYEWFRHLYDRASIVLVDGWPILRLAVTESGERLSPAHRIGSTDWLAQLSKNQSLDSYRIYVLGGSAESNSAARANLSSGMPTAAVAGRSGFFDLSDKSELERVAAEIREFRPDLVIVGMGMPRQEQFLDECIELLPPAYYATVGGAIDYIGGVNRLAPRFLGPMGLEWLWRLAVEPRRLFRRYCIEPFALLGLVVRNRILGKSRR